MKRNKDKNSYLKFLAVIDILKTYSNKENPLSIIQIQNYFKNQDFHLDYRLLDTYIHNYNEYHDDTIIQKIKNKNTNYYYYVHSTLDIMEAKAIVDLVYSSDFFTPKTKENYLKRMQSLFSKNDASKFTKVLDLHIEKNENDQVFYKELDLIIQAINQNKKISFIYHKPSLDNIKEPKRTVLAPIDTYFINNEYYLFCQGAKDPEICIIYRLDYVHDVSITNESFSFTPIQLQNFQTTLKNISNAYSEGDTQIIELEFDRSVYSNIIDKFGKRIKPIKIKDNHYKLKVKHTINATFYSWIIGFGGKVKIIGDDKQIDNFKSFLSQFTK